MLRPAPFSRPALAALAIAILCLALPAQREQASRWITGNVPGRGLPQPTAKWCPWHPDEDHVTNRVFRSLFVVRLVPTEVARALPSEHSSDEAFFVTDWYFATRPGTQADERVYGGDSMHMPRDRFEESESKVLAADLAAIDGEVAAELKRTPRLAIWFQNDLLRMAQRLVETGHSPELLPHLLRAAERVALPRAQLEAEANATFELSQITALEPAISANRLVEIDRWSTKHFRAGQSMMWSRVFVQWPVGDRKGLDAYLAAAQTETRDDPEPVVPLHTRAALVQGLVALADDGTAVATRVVVDVRLQHLAGTEPLSPDNPTTTHDGLDFRTFWLERQAARERSEELGLDDFRELHGDDEVLFRDYGTAKHTTVRGQCALCHRRTGTPETGLMGFAALRRGSKPRRVPDPGTRLRLAETEFLQFVVDLRKQTQ